ncbi:MAG TPA: DegT/DnrJ/EryC1/StrS family aminotransferase [Candidatus Saccharimonadales bacterium]
MIMQIPIYKPYLPKESLDYAHKALDSTWISSKGDYIQIVQEKLQELLNTKHVLLVNNGTSACHLVAKALTHKHGINKIIVPNNVYVAAWNAFLFDKEYELLGIDADLDTWNFDLQELDITIKMYPEAAVLVVHNVGNIINVPELQKKYPSTVFVEDNCEGFLGTYNGMQSGTAGFASAISFFGNKNITCGEGGAFITNDESAYNFIKSTHAQGQSSTRFIHDILGNNFRMTNIQAAILLGQLEVLPEIWDRKLSLFENYRDALDGRQDIFMQTMAPDTAHSNWMFGVRIPGNENYEKAELYFKGQGIEIRPMFYPIHAHQYLVNDYSVSWSNCDNAELLNKECFILPSYVELTKQEQDHIITTVEAYIKYNRDKK